MRPNPWHATGRREAAALTAMIFVHGTDLTRAAPRARVAIAGSGRIGATLGRTRTGAAKAAGGTMSLRVKTSGMITPTDQTIARASITATITSGHKRGPRHRQASSSRTTMTGPRTVDEAAKGAPRKSKHQPHSSARAW